MFCRMQILKRRTVRHRIPFLYIAVNVLTAFFLFCPMRAQAAGEGYASDIFGETAADEIYAAYQMQDIQEELNRLFPTGELSLKELFSAVFTGNMDDTYNYFIKGVWRMFAGELSEMKSVFVMILSIGIVAALFSNFMDIFENHQIADISFYFAYMLLMTLLLRVFDAAAGIARESLQNLLIFMKLFLPTYFTAVSVAAGTTTAYVFYRLMLVLIYVVEHLLSAAIFPFIYGYAFLSIVNGLWTEERLNNILDMIQKGVAYALKTLLTLISGVSVLQAMVTPVIDSVKVAALQKAVSIIPGIGSFANGVSELFIGSAILIKNSIGVVLVIVLLVFCMAPLVKLLTVSVLLKGSAALVGIICDKRMTNCIDRMGDSAFMLLRITVTSVILFIITIAIVICSTNLNM